MAISGLFLFTFAFSNNLQNKTVVFSGIQTRIVAIVDNHTNNLTTTTVQKLLLLRNSLSLLDDVKLNPRFLNIGQIRPLFVHFRPFLYTIINIVL